MGSSYLENFEDLKDLTEKEMKNQPWKMNFLEKVQLLSRKYAIVWLRIATDIDDTEVNNKQNMKIFLETVEGNLQDLITDMDNLYEKHVELLDKQVNKLSELEIKLGITSQFDVNNMYQEKSLVKLRQAIEDRIKELESDLAEKQKTQMILEIEKLTSELEKLWDCFNYTTDEKREFLSSIDKTSKNSLEYLEREIDRLKMLKRENKKEIVENLKKQLEKLWDICHCDGNIRNDFPLIYTQTSSEDVIETFEREIKKWQNYYNKNKNILDGLKLHASLRDKLQEMEINKNKEKLYKNRGGELLTEIRKRNIIESRLKKNAEKLFNLSKDYLKQNGEDFLTFGATIEEYINKGNNKKIPSEPMGKVTPTASNCIGTRNIRGNKMSLTPVGKSIPKKLKTPLSEQPQKRKQIKKATPTLPKFKLNETRNSSPTKRINWKPSLVSQQFSEKSDEDWTSEYSDFEKDVQHKKVPRSSSILK